MTCGQIFCSTNDFDSESLDLTLRFKQKSNHTVYFHSTPKQEENLRKYFSTKLFYY